jgi:flavin-dependent thymidylate synthase
MSLVPAWLQVHRASIARNWAMRFRASRAADDRHSTDPLLKDVASNRHSLNTDGTFVSPFDTGHILVGNDGLKVRLVQGPDESTFKTIAALGLTASIGWDPDIGPPVEADWSELMRGGLQMALETATVVFAVSGVSRTCTHQLVRSRRAAFHQQSQRSTYMGDDPETRIPESVWRNQRARLAFMNALDAARQAYRVACEEDISYQDARFGLLEGTTGSIMCSYSLREFIDVYAYRACSMMGWEIVQVMRLMKGELLHAAPWLEPYVKITCEKTKGAIDAGDWSGAVSDSPKLAHTCTFQGWEQVEGACPFAWARESNRTFRSERFSIGSESGRRDS